jgi:hypothetical protein
LIYYKETVFWQTVFGTFANIRVANYKFSGINFSYFCVKISLGREVAYMGGFSKPFFETND